FGFAALLHSAADDDLPLEGLIAGIEKPAFPLLHEFPEGLDVAVFQRAKGGVFFFDDFQPVNVVAGDRIVRKRDIAGRGAFVMGSGVTAAVTEPAALSGIVVNEISTRHLVPQCRQKLIVVKGSIFLAGSF